MGNQGQTMSDWIIRMRRAGLEINANAFHSQKKEDMKRLRESELPTSEEFTIPYTEFNEDNNSLTEFLSKYSRFVIRALPKTSKLPRRYKKGLTSLEECTDFLAEIIKEGQEDLYSVSLIEHPYADWSGIIISRPGDLLIEIVPGGVLDHFAHGKETPTTAAEFKFHNHNHFRSMQYKHLNKDHNNQQRKKEREVIWRTLQYLRKDNPSGSDIFPNIKFTEGYFEFIYTKDSKPMFTDYKVNPAYLV